MKKKKVSYKTICINVHELEWLRGVCQDADIRGIFGLHDSCFSDDLAQALLDGKTVKLRVFRSSLERYRKEHPEYE